MSERLAHSQAGFFVQYGLHEAVGVEVALHQRVDPALASRHGARERGRVLAIRLDHLEDADVPADLVGDGADFVDIADQNRLDEAGIGGVTRALQSDGVDGVDDSGADGLAPLCRVEQAAMGIRRSVRRAWLPPSELL